MLYPSLPDYAHLALLPGLFLHGKLGGLLRPNLLAPALAILIIIIPIRVIIIHVCQFCPDKKRK